MGSRFIGDSSVVFEFCGKVCGLEVVGGGLEL